MSRHNKDHKIFSANTLKDLINLKGRSIKNVDNYSLSKLTSLARKVGIDWKTIHKLETVYKKPEYYEIIKDFMKLKGDVNYTYVLDFPFIEKGETHLVNKKTLRKYDFLKEKIIDNVIHHGTDDQIDYLFFRFPRKYLKTQLVPSNITKISEINADTGEIISETNVPQPVDYKDEIAPIVQWMDDEKREDLINKIDDLPKDQQELVKLVIKQYDTETKEIKDDDDDELMDYYLEQLFNEPNYEEPSDDYLEMFEENIHPLRMGLAEGDSVVVKIDEKYRNFIFERLNEIIDEMMETPLNPRLRIEFKFSDSLKTYLLNKETIDQIKEYIKNKGYELINEAEQFGSDVEQVLYSLGKIDEIKFYLSKPVEANKNYKDRGGSFFKYKIDAQRFEPKVLSLLLPYLNECQIYCNTLNIIHEPCLVYALKQSIDLTVGEKLIISHMVKSSYIKTTIIEKIANKLNLSIKVCIMYNTTQKSRYLSYGNGPKIIKLNLIEDHYFIQKDINVHGFKTTRDMVKYLFKEDAFIPLTLKEITLGTNVIQKDINLNDLLDHEIKLECSDITENKIKNYDYDIWFADFEASTDLKDHVAYCACGIDSEGKNEIKAWGPDCAIKLLDFITKSSNKNILIYFHNLSYDINFINKYVIKGLRKGSKWLSATLKFNSKTIQVKDSYSIIPAPLKAFGKMFGLEISKEIFPYDLYNSETLKSDYIDCTTFISSLPKYTNQEIEDAIKKSKAKCGKRINLKYYALYYCMIDVKVLKDGFNVFSKGLKESFGINVTSFITISSLSNYLLNQSLVGKNVVQYNGVIRSYIQQAVYGGRCMTSYNKQYKLNEKVADFDATSLYPSAIIRLSELKYPVGYPSKIKTSINKIIDSVDDLTDELNKPCIVDVEILEIKNKLPFPIIVKKTEAGNLNDDSDEMIGYKFTVDDIYLKDLITFQGCKLKILQGLYWSKTSEEPSIAMRNLIQDCFNQRLKYKKEKNPVEVIYKLILNSIYGKTIQKPIDNELKFVDNDYIDSYIDKNYQKIVCIDKIDNKSIVKVNKQINEFKNNALLGVRILSMSKRIMNEVCCLKIDERYPKIYYTDTDSIFINKDDLDQLIPIYEKKYNRKLVGNMLGQFSSDFPDDKYSVESIFLGKKAYCHKMNDDTYIKRLKGIPEYSLDYLSNETKQSPMKIYEQMNEGPVVFNLLIDGHVSFKFNSNMSVSSLKHFERSITFKKTNKN